jgi:hypothetical protein
MVNDPGSEEEMAPTPVTPATTLDEEPFDLSAGAIHKQLAEQRENTRLRVQRHRKKLREKASASGANGGQAEQPRPEEEPKADEEEATVRAQTSVRRREGGGGGRGYDPATGEVTRILDCNRQETKFARKSATFKATPQGQMVHGGWVNKKTKLGEHTFAKAWKAHREVVQQVRDLHFPDIPFTELNTEFGIMSDGCDFYVRLTAQAYPGDREEQRFCDSAYVRTSKTSPGLVVQV